MHESLPCGCSEAGPCGKHGQIDGTTSLQDKLRELVAKWREFSHIYSGESWMGARKRAEFCADELEEILNDDYPPITESLSHKVEILIEQTSRPHELGTCRDALDRLLCTYCANHVPAHIPAHIPALDEGRGCDCRHCQERRKARA